MEGIESFIVHTKATIVFGETGAIYDHILDFIEMPRRDTFANPPEYYAEYFTSLDTGQATRAALTGLLIFA